MLILTDGADIGTSGIKRTALEIAKSNNTVLLDAVVPGAVENLVRVLGNWTLGVAIFKFGKLVVFQLASSGIRLAFNRLSAIATMTEKVF